MRNSTNKIIGFTFVAAIIIISTFKAEAQRMEAGIRFMPTVSSFGMKNSSGGTVTGEALIGFGVGGFFAYNFSEHIGIQGELIYSSLSQKFKETDNEQDINLGYVNIPILFSYNTSKNEGFNINLVIGPQIGFSAGSNIFKAHVVGTNHEPAVLSVKAGDLGLAYGAGIDFGLNHENNIRLGVGFRGVYGLIDISDNSQTVVTGSYYILDKTKLVTYSGYVGLSFLF